MKQWLSSRVFSSNGAARFKKKKTQLGGCQKLTMVKKRGTTATSAPSQSNLRYTE
jgi:hypothetical protein